MTQGIFTFPHDFLWGTATAAHHVEGNNTNNDWWAWEQSGRILNQHKSGLACNWWDLEVAKTDLDTAAAMGTRAHRLSVEWSRIEPEPSVFDQNALDHYRALLEAMHARGIEPMVTLHHFTNPLWLVEKGDFQSGVVVDYFQRFTKKVVDSLGDLIPKWVTINEPMVYFVLRHLNQVFPQPKEGSGWLPGLRQVRHMLQCHAAAYHTIKEKYPRAQVGIAKNFPVFSPARPGNRLDQWWSGRLWWAFNDLWMRVMVSGHAPLLFGGGTIRGLQNSFDFVGVNYYTRFMAQFPYLPKNEWPAGAIISDGNYGEIYPKGFYEVLKYANRFRKPIYVTENGVPDQEDKLRPGFILSHLHQMWHAICFNYPVMGYYHWSLIDNFEWDRGWTQRFGLIAMDPETQERRLRPSGELYGEICRQNGLSSQMVERYAIHLMPQLFPDY